MGEAVDDGVADRVQEEDGVSVSELEGVSVCDDEAVAV